MKVPYGEGLAPHTELESCTAVRKFSREALTKESAGEVLSREIYEILGCRRFGDKWKATSAGPLGEVRQSSTRSETLSMHGNNTCENREIPCSPGAKLAKGRIGKSKDVIR